MEEHCQYELFIWHEVQCDITVLCWTFFGKTEVIMAAECYCYAEM